jgi:predicted mannosyl-3-phosphoglycerate phosphatase (HAD superfamily)
MWYSRIIDHDKTHGDTMIKIEDYGHSHDEHLTYADYERLITEAVRELRRLTTERAPLAERRAARDAMWALKNDCEDVYGHNPGGWD